MRNIFLEKSYTKCGGETFPRPFSEKSKLGISLDQEFKSFIQFAFIECQVDGYLKILKLSSRSRDFTSYKAFSKNKNRSGTSLPSSFSV